MIILIFIDSFFSSFSAYLFLGVVEKAASWCLGGLIIAVLVAVIDPPVLCFSPTLTINHTPTKSLKN
jgi:hypothetical protein